MTPDQLEARNKAVENAMKNIYILLSTEEPIRAIFETLWLEGWIRGANELKGIDV